MKDNKFFNEKKVFITGHTGFKGSWLCKILLELGADVWGYSLHPTENQPLFELSGVSDHMNSIFGDIRNLELLEKSLCDVSPDIVIHMAAQPLVRESYKNPIDTYSTNVMGTVNILEASRKCGSIKSMVNVTTDKVYFNHEERRAFVEDDMLNGFDPYSNSKSCSELVTSCYKNSFFNDRDIAVSTCRAGNVIGGGDFAKDRIIPDCYNAISRGKDIKVRNPYSVRPYQHVLEPLFAYLLLAEKQFENHSLQGEYNIGPDEENNIDTGTLVDLFCKSWGTGSGWKSDIDTNAVHEANLLYLNCEKAKKVLGWHNVWNIENTIEKTVEWYREYYHHNDIRACMENQIKEFWHEAFL